MNKAEELKARLRRFAKPVADFSDNNKGNKIEKVEYVRLDMALSAIDELSGLTYLGKPIKKLEEYKGRNIWDWNGTITVNDPADGMEHQYIVCMDDSKKSGLRTFDEKQNTVEAAREYIDWLSK